MTSILQYFEFTNLHERCSSNGCCDWSELAVLFLQLHTANELQRYRVYAVKVFDCLDICLLLGLTWPWSDISWKCQAQGIRRLGLYIEWRHPHQLYNSCNKRESEATIKWELHFDEPVPKAYQLLGRWLYNGGAQLTSRPSSDVVQDRSNWPHATLFIDDPRRTHLKLSSYRKLVRCR